MKYAAIFILFLFFAVCLSGVKFADAYSARYQACAQAWEKAPRSLRSAQRAAFSNGQRRNGLAEPCPAAVHKHRDRIVRFLTGA